MARLRLNTLNIHGVLYLAGLVLVGIGTCRADTFTKQDFDDPIGILCRGTEKAGHYHVLATVDKIIGHGDQTLPWLMSLLDDRRTMGTIVIKNRGEGNFEAFVTYSPTYIGDVARAIVNGLTGFGDRTGLERISERQRSKAIKKWRAWYKRHRDKLKWLPAKREFDCSFPRSTLERHPGRSASRSTLTDSSLVRLSSKRAKDPFCTLSGGFGGAESDDGLPYP